MDKIFHFLISFALSVIGLLFLLAFMPKLKRNVPRFWQAESDSKRKAVTIFIGIAFLVVITVGIAKEWIDALGFGNVEVGDVVADLLGITAGVYLILIKVKKEQTRRVKISFRSSSKSRHPSKVNLFKNPKGRKSPRFESKIIASQQPDD